MRDGEASGRRMATEETLEGIRSLIRERSLKVGDGLPTEGELAETLGTSRNTVREAFRTLKAYGIVETRPKTGAVLTDRRHQASMNIYAFGLDISPEAFTDIQGFRMLVEDGIGHELFTRATQADLVRLRSLNGALIECSDTAGAAQLDFDFHIALVDLAGNRTASDVYRILRPSILKIMQLGKLERANRAEMAAEHSEIIGAIEERDAAAYSYFVRRHLRQGLRYL